MINRRCSWKRSRSCCCPSRICGWILLAIVLVCCCVTMSEASFDKFDNYDDGPARHSRTKRASPHWIKALTSAEIASVKSGWLSHGEACKREEDANARNYFTTNPNTTETVQSLLNGEQSKSGVCDFLGKYLWCSTLLGSCICRKGAAFITADNECKLVEGAFDCDRNYYDASFVDNITLDNRANLYEPLKCVVSATCAQDDRLRNAGDTKSQIFICKPNTPGVFPEAKKWILSLSKRAFKYFKWLGRGKACKIHLNTHSDVTPHTTAKEDVMKEFASNAREAVSKCNVLQNEECHKVARVCHCGKGFALQDDECRLSGSETLFDDNIRKCEWDLWPTFIVSDKLMQLEKYVPDTLPITCVTNATCEPNAACDTSSVNNPDCFNTCQCEPGKVCAVPEPLVINSAQNLVPSLYLLLPVLIWSQQKILEMMQ